jgi:hypothetical protein
LIDMVVETGTDSTGWLLWHVTLSHDGNVSELQGRQQVWLAAGPLRSHSGSPTTPATNTPLCGRANLRSRTPGSSPAISMPS